MITEERQYERQALAGCQRKERIRTDMAEELRQQRCTGMGTWKGWERVDT